MCCIKYVKLVFLEQGVPMSAFMKIVVDQEIFIFICPGLRYNVCVVK